MGSIDRKSGKDKETEYFTSNMAWKREGIVNQVCLAAPVGDGQ